MKVRSLHFLPLTALLLTGCGSASDADAGAAQAVSSSATTQVASAESTAQGQIDPDSTDTSEGGAAGGDPISQQKEQFPGYPVLVDLASIDTRVAGSLEGNTYNNKVVALAPGLYAPYNANITDLDKYYDTGIVYGDSMMRDEYLPDTGGSTWGGVQPGTQEPEAKPAAASAATGESELATQLKKQFPSYPVLVDLGSIDTRVAGSLEGNTYNNKVVALAPGLYAPYNANFTDLDKYYDTGIVYGDSMMRDEYLPDTGGSTWGGVQPGTQEPPQ